LLLYKESQLYSYDGIYLKSLYEFYSFKGFPDQGGRDDPLIELINGIYQNQGISHLIAGLNFLPTDTSSADKKKRLKHSGSSGNKIFYMFK